MTFISEFNSTIAPCTIVERMEFCSDLMTGRCTLRLDMVDDDRRPATRVVVEAGGVAEVSVRELGGGITQIACLRARDIREFGYDRIRFILEDVEDQALILKCESLTANRLPTRV